MQLRPHSTLQHAQIEKVTQVLDADERVVFAYLYGSFAEGDQYHDLDIAVFASPLSDHFRLPVELKIACAKHTGVFPDFFDIRIINRLLEDGDLFALLYLRNVLAANRLLVDHDFNKRTDFIEQYNLKYRENEGLLDEVLS